MQVAGRRSSRAPVTKLFAGAFVTRHQDERFRYGIPFRKGFTPARGGFGPLIDDRARDPDSLLFFYFTQVPTWRFFCGC